MPVIQVIIIFQFMHELAPGHGDFPWCVTSSKRERAGTTGSGADLLAGPALLGAVFFDVETGTGLLAGGVDGRTGALGRDGGVRDCVP